MKTKQTAVEFLLSKIIFMPGIDMEDGRRYMILKPGISFEDIEQAKAMEKEQIIEAHLDGQTLVSCKDEYAELYYDDTYGTKKQYNGKNIS